MFSDLVGSTQLAARMDPEDLREVISAYQKCVAETVRRLNGFVARYMGDGALIYFGYPEAHEDDAERALRAGLELIVAVTELNLPVSLQSRVGIATGMVVVGDLTQSGDAQERGIVGETPNVAARLQGIAEPNMIVIAESTRALVGNLFELQDLGRRELKGIAEPVRAWAALRASSIEGRFEALHTTELTELIGREEELELLLQRWETAKSGEGQGVLISGEAGIGKSRLAAALLERLASKPHTRLRYFCSPQHADSALYPIIGQMERAAGLAHDDTPQTKLDKLDAVLSEGSTSAQHAALFAEMLSLPNDGRYPPLELTSQQRRQRTLEALTAQLEALTRSDPVLMIFEDAHWGDPTSLEALGRAVDRIANLCVLLIVTFRPEFAPPWIRRRHVTAMTLNRLAVREVSAMIDRVAGNKSLAADIRQDIIERTDGIPLFVEEMTKAVLEAESEGDARRTASAVPSRALAVPATLQASLMARLDRLGPAKEVAQIGAAIGREFSHALLRAVAPMNEAALDDALDRLVDSELVFRRGTARDGVYIFKHALVQDTAYDTLLRSRRQQLHEAIARTLEQQFPDIVAAEPGTLAYHFTEASLPEPAIGYWLKAGQRAAERSADQEAVRHLERGLALLGKLPESHDRDRRELDFQITSWTPLVAVRGFTSPEAAAARERATVLSEKSGDVDRLYASLYAEYVYCMATGKTRKGLGFAERCLTLGVSKGDRAKSLTAHRAVGVAFFQLGEFASARKKFEQALLMYDPALDRSIGARYISDPSAVSSAFLALVLWISGYPEQAAKMQAQALSYAAELNHFNTSGLVHVFAGAELEQLFGNVGAMLAHTQILSSLATEHGVLAWRNYEIILGSWAVSWTSRPERGISPIEEAIADCDATGNTFHLGHLTNLLAQLHARLGDYESAARLSIDARERAQRAEEYVWEAELHRNEGEVRRGAGNPAIDVEDCFGRALKVARHQGARMFELRAATNLAQLWRDQGRRAEARDLLAPIYNWFTEGFDTLDLKQAKTLLGTLGS
jgi:class 3 adenylate cyclase/tetratricopeptide (TPR) repeat protein